MHLINIVVSLIISSTNIFSQVLDIPFGKPVETDGIIEKIEWNDAIETNLVGGKFLKLKYDSQYLYVAIKGSEGGYCSLGILSNKEIKILHSSTRLISATYNPGIKDWILTDEFGALANAKRNNPVDEKDQLSEFGWYANLVSQGSVDETEYKISRKMFDANDLKLAVVFFQIKAKQKYTFAPEGLNDGSLNPELISGSIVNKIYFDPSNWFVVKYK